MDKIKSGTDTQPAADAGKAPASSRFSRRKLIKLGASTVPVVATLASRPALAWHCQTPSAWGSEIINPNTSLKANAGHKTYGDEVYYISNWYNNNTNGSSMGTNPWEALLAMKPSLKTSATSDSSGNFSYTKVTVGFFFSTCTNIVRPSGLTDTTKLYTVFNTGSFQAAVIVAQLNFWLLSTASGNDVEFCVDSTKLKAMAGGSYSPPNLGVTWDATQIKNYLSQNWIARFNSNG